MKKVINGLIYNTETARRVYCWDNGLYPGDFGRCEEDLYVTKKGAFFLHGEGGPLTRWATSVAGGRSSGSGIEALTTQQALEWCETHDVPADTIADSFDVGEA